jgi:Golgi phosphoprotein 3
MSSAAGLSRRRVAQTSSSYNDDDDDARKRRSTPLSASPTHSHHNGSATPAAALHAGSAFEGGSKIAYDPRDLAQEATDEARLGGKMPRLTLMEEVLLLGLKDKQVCVFLSSHSS